MSENKTIILSILCGCIIGITLLIPFIKAIM